MEFIFLSEFLIDYPVMEHMPSDVGMNQLFLPPSRFDMQNSLNDIAEWTNYNLMALNENKSNFIIFSRSKKEFTTRLYLNRKYLEKQSVIKLLGIWLDEDLSLNTNTREICKKVFFKNDCLVG